MRNIKARLQLLVAIICMTPSAAYGQCVVFGNPEKSFAISDVVFVGTVVAREPTGVVGAHVIVDVGTFRVERSWKGSRDREIRIGSDVQFEVGKKYVVFAFSKPGEPATTSMMCDWTEPFVVAKDKLEWLSKQPSQAVGER